MPLVAIFFTLLFGIMFGDVGQGLVFVGIGILLRRGVIKKFAAWQKFAPIFVGIGCSSTVMGFLNGEFFSNHHVLDFIGSAVAGLFGTTYPFLHLMPNSDSIHRVFYFFIFTLGIGFIINSTGLVVNIINQVSLKHLGKALFGKTGLSGALFFWYVIALAVRIAVWKYAVSPADWAVMGLCLGGVFLGEPLERLVEGERPVFEDGLGVAAIHGVVEVLEIISSYFSNSLSFLRVGAFALAHAVLGFIIFTMTDLIGGAASPSGILVTVAGNAVVILLEGMIVAIQVIRLQYYEFFSKFFTETGKEFIPFRFTYRP
jgi:V/A-type H+-transporting ATPase subunit I